MNEGVVQEAEAVEAHAQPEAEPADHQQQLAEPEAGAAEAQAPEREHALEPGGERFKQVWARAKRAEEEKEALREKLHQEQLERSRLEGERAEAEKQRQQQQKQAEREYTWPELRTMISNGQITEDAAYDYKDKMQKKREDAMRQEFESKIAQLTVKDKVGTINSTLERYKTAMPTLMQPGTAERTKYESEYKYLVEELGDAPTLATQLKAVRAAFGPIESVESAAKTRTATTQQRTPFMDTATPRKPEPPKKDPVQQLDARTKEHYEKLIKHGRYGPFRAHIGVTDEHWAKVREELTWTRGKR